MRLATIVLVSSFPAVAAADDGVVATTTVAHETWHIVPNVSVGIEDFHYAELSPTLDANGNQPVLDRETAVAPTARVEVEATSPHSMLFARASLSWTGGSMNYDGSIEDVSTGAVTPISGTSTGYMTDVDLVAGARLHVGDRVMLGAFVGIGHHTWERDLRPVDPSSGTGYLEQYAWSYWQGGIRVDAAASERLHFSLEGAVLVPMSGSLALTHQQNGFDDDYVQLAFGLGTRLRLVGAYALTSTISLTAVAGLETDNISSSTDAPVSANGVAITDGMGDQLYLSEPYSNTTRVMLNVGAGYAF